MRPSETKPFTLHHDLPASMLPLESYSPSDVSLAQAPDAYKFPLCTAPPLKPWQPRLEGDGDFPTFDAVALAQEALAKLDAGMLRLHEEAGFTSGDPAPRGRAA